MTGWQLWCKSNRVGLAMVMAVIAAALLGVFLWVRTRNGGQIDDTPFLLAFLVTLAMTVSIGGESVYEALVQRTIMQRRCVLVALDLVFAAVLGTIFFHGLGGEFGLMAFLRDFVALLGLALLSFSWLPQWTVWAVPLAIGLFFAPFTPTYGEYPVSEVWLFLKRPAHGFGLDWIIAVVIYALGLASFCSPHTIIRQVDF